MKCRFEVIIDELMIWVGSRQFQRDVDEAVLHRDVPLCDVELEIARVDLRHLFDLFEDADLDIWTKFLQYKVKDGESIMDQFAGVRVDPFIIVAMYF